MRCTLQRRSFFSLRSLREELAPLTLTQCVLGLTSITTVSAFFYYHAQDERGKVSMIKRAKTMALNTPILSGALMLLEGGGSCLS